MTANSPTSSEKANNFQQISLPVPLPIKGEGRGRGPQGLLIFGGTTEGRLAASVCDEAGTTFYYSTKTGKQEVEMLHGACLSGAMTAEAIRQFCAEHGVLCIIDAAHPFAENLHRTIDAVGLPVIRLQRDFASRQDDIIYCKDYTDAIEKLTKADIKNLLALSGVNTIAKLKPYWQSHKTTFRILNREESLAVVNSEGLPEANILFYNESLSLPDKDSELAMMHSVGCDAILTKESGSAGGFDAKIEAARQLGIKVFVIEHPALPQHWTYVTGKYGLRKAIERIVPKFFPLKTGFTTGACATAATKAALLSLLYDEQPEEVRFALPDGETMSIPVTVRQRGTASCTKDFSDDPDVTKGCEITSKVELLPEGVSDIIFAQGEGVGTVTLPGLGIPVGEPAINPTPRKMITAEVRQLTDRGVRVTISVANGRELAKRTFNHKVGVVDGISIIGTSGIVRPLSNDAFVQSIRKEMEVARAIGCEEIGLVAGMKSEEALHLEQPKLRCIHYGNFVGEALKTAHDLGFRSVTLAIMIGKAVKLAEGNLDTHSHKVSINKDFILQVCSSLSLPPGGGLERGFMARDLWNIMPPEFFDRIRDLCEHHCRKVFPTGCLRVILVPPM